MPDGRLLIIERRRLPRASEETLELFPLLFWIALMSAIFIIGPFLSHLMGAVVWLTLPILMIVGGLTYLLQRAVFNWMRSATPEPEISEVIGMDCSTEEMEVFVNECAAFAAAQGAAH